MKCQWKDCPRTATEEVWKDGHAPHIFVCKEHSSAIEVVVTQVKDTHRHEAVHELIDHLPSRAIGKLCRALRQDRDDKCDGSEPCSQDGCQLAGEVWLKDIHTNTKLRAMCAKHFDQLMMYGTMQFRNVHHRKSV
jgi:hypothetical protein